MSEQEYKELFARRLYELLERKNMKQNELASILGVSESAVGKWLLKINIPRMGIIQKLSEHFNVPKSYFINEDYDDPYSPEAERIAELLGRPEYKILFDKTKDLTPEEIERIVKIIELTLDK